MVFKERVIPIIGKQLLFSGLDASIPGASGVAMLQTGLRNYGRAISP